MARVLFKKNKFIKAPCYMCDSARISGDLCDGFDFSAIGVGNTHSLSKRFMICSGNNQPVQIIRDLLFTDNEMVRITYMACEYQRIFDIALKEGGESDE